MSSKTCSLFIVLTFFVTACSHSPTNSDISNNEITAADATADTTVAVAPDFIGPPIPAATVESPNAGEQLIWQHIAKNLTLSQFYKHPARYPTKTKVPARYRLFISRKPSGRTFYLFYFN